MTSPILVAHLSRSRELGHRGLKPAQGLRDLLRERQRDRSLVMAMREVNPIDDGVRILDIDVFPKGGRSASFGPCTVASWWCSQARGRARSHLGTRGRAGDGRRQGGPSRRRTGSHAMHGRPPRRRSKRPGNDTATMTVPRRRECPSTVGSAREGRSCTRRAESKRPARRPPRAWRRRGESPRTSDASPRPIAVRGAGCASSPAFGP